MQGAKLDAYYFKLHCKGWPVAGRVLLFEGEPIGSVLWVCNKTELKFSVNYL